MSDNGTTRVSTIAVVRYEGGDLYAVVKRIISERSTGRLTLNVSQGGIGSLEWQGVKRSWSESDQDKMSQPGA